MDSKSKTLRRLGITSLGALIALGTPFAGFAGSASAATPTLIIDSQLTNTASTLSDGTNTTVKISAVVTGAPTLPSGDGVKFTLTPTGPGTTVTATDFTSPYSVDLAPTANGTYTESAMIVTSTGADAGIDTESKSVTVGAFSSVHITSPSDGGVIGVDGLNELNNGTNSPGSIVVTGTRSTDLPQITVKASTRNNVTGDFVVGSNAVTYPAGTVQNKGTQQWTLVVPVPQCPGANAVNTSCDVVVYAAATGGPGFGSSDESSQAGLYDQSLNTGQGGLTLTPATATIATNSASQPSSQTYTVAAKDQNGQPVVGLKIAISASGSQTGVNGPSVNGGSSSTTVTTGPDGTATFTVADASAETITITATSERNGTSPDFAAGSDSDVTTTATLTTYTANISTLTFVVLPDKGVYASNGAAEYTGSTDTTATPQVDICVADQNGNGVKATTPAQTNLFVDIARSYVPSGDEGSTPTTSESSNNDPAHPTSSANNGNHVAAGQTVKLTPDPDSSRSNCYIVSHEAADNIDGTDTYDAYVNNNGVPGFQTATTDVAATTKVLKFAELEITDNGKSLAQKGTNATGSFTVVGTDGTPFANRVISLSVPADSTNQDVFPSSGQPAGTTVTSGSNGHAATCTTDSNGVCNYVLTEPTNLNNGDNDVTVTATDNLTLPTPNNNNNPGQSGYVPSTQVATGASDSDTVAFTNSSVALTSATVEDTEAVYPDTTSCGAAEPGAPLDVELNLENASGQDLPNTAVTLTTSDGYFTPLPGNSVNNVGFNGNASDYSSYTFDPAPSDGAKVGALHSTGTTFTGKTDANGDVYFALGMTKDAGFTDDGNVFDSLTVAANGGTKTVKNLVNTGACEDLQQPGMRRASESPNVSSITPDWSTNSDVTDQEPINPGAVTILPDTALDKLSGKVQEIQGQFGAASFFENGTAFYVATTDSYGNLVSDAINPVQFSATGADVQFFEGDTNDGFNDGSTASIVGSYTSTKHNEQNNLDGTEGSDNVLTVTSDAPLTAGQDVTVTGTWNAPTHVWQASIQTPITFQVVDGPSQAVTDSFTINLYEIDLFHLHYQKLITPHKVVRTGDTVHDSIRVTDQNNQAVHGLFAIFHQSGPGPIDLQTTKTTDDFGLASLGFSSIFQGNSTVTIDVEEQDSGVLLNETSDRVGFDGTPTLSATPHSHTGAVHVTFSGHTRAGAKVQLQVKNAAGHYVNSGGPHTATSGGTFSIGRHVTHTHRYRVRVDNLQNSDSHVVTIHKKKKKK